MEWVSLAVSVVALAVSAWAVVYAKRQAESNERLAKIEEARHAEEVRLAGVRARYEQTARVEVSVDPAPGVWSGRTLRVRNAGGAVAQAVVVTLRVDGEHGDAPTFSDQNAVAGWPAIAAGETKTRALLVDGDTARHFIVDTEWCDGNGFATQRYALDLAR